MSDLIKYVTDHRDEIFLTGLLIALLMIGVSMSIVAYTLYDLHDLYLNC